MAMMYEVRPQEISSREAPVVHCMCGRATLAMAVLIIAARITNGATSARLRREYFEAAPH
jgi:hypothetical protein